MRPEDPRFWPGQPERIEDSGPLFRPYAVTGGRVEPAVGRLDLIAYVVANPLGRLGRLRMQPEHRAVLAMAHDPISIAEVAAGLNLAVGIVRVLLGDLLEHSLISISDPPAQGTPSSEPVLRKVLDGLRNL